MIGTLKVLNQRKQQTTLFIVGGLRPAYIIFMQNTHRIKDLTESLCRAQAIFYALPNNRRGSKYHGFTYSGRVNL